MLKLYHGSNVVIDKIDLCLSRKGKDFGCGFYLNPIESQAMEMADSYAYLRRFKGIDFLVDCYAAEHTLSIEDAVEDIMLLCQKNGGRVGC